MTPIFGPFANNAVSTAYYGGERVEVIATWLDKRGDSITTIRYMDGSKKTVFTSQIQVGLNDRRAAPR